MRARSPQSIGHRGYVDVPVTANDSPVSVTQSPQSEFAESYARMTSQHVPVSVSVATGPSPSHVVPATMQALNSAYGFGLEDYDLLDWLLSQSIVDPTGAQMLAERLGSKRVDFTKDSPVIQSLPEPAEPVREAKVDLGQGPIARFLQDSSQERPAPAASPPAQVVKKERVIDMHEALMRLQPPKTLIDDLAREAAMWGAPEPPPGVGKTNAPESTNA